MFLASGSSIHTVGKAAWGIPSYYCCSCSLLLRRSRNQNYNHHHKQRVDHKQRVVLFGSVQHHQHQQQQTASSVLDDWRDRVREGHWRGGDAGQEQAVRTLRRLQRTLERLQWDNAMVQRYHEQREQQQQRATTEEPPKQSLMGHVVHHPRRPLLDTTDAITDNINVESNKTHPNPNHMPSSASESIVPNLQPTLTQPLVPPSIPRGVYLYGSVGTGKSMLMDRFFALTNLSKKKRYHFHEFMSDLHRRWHVHRTRTTPPEAAPAACTNSISQSSPLPEEQQQQEQQPFLSPILRAAHELANECSLLCLDEFQVLDVADAVLLRQVLGHLLVNGTVLVTTSNRPLSYYLDKQHRLDQHTHYIATLLQRYCVSHAMETETDYRQLLAVSAEANPNNDNIHHDPAVPLLPHSMYMVLDDDNAPEPADAATCMRQRIEQVLQCVLGEDYETSVTPLPLGARRHVEIVSYSTSTGTVDDIPQQQQRVVIGQVSFDDLCVHHHLVAADYRLLAERVHGLCVTDLPPSISDSLRGHDVARRWVHCIDSLYEARIPLLCTNMTQPRTPLSQLFVSTRRTKTPNMSGDDKDDATDELLWADQATSAEGYAQGALVSVEDLPVAMRRAASRLVEMTSRQWWSTLAPTHPDDGDLKRARAPEMK